MDIKKIFKKDFTMVLIGQVISLFGNAILRFAIPLFLLKETKSSILFGIVTACSFIPMIIFSFIGGFIADRINKRDIMVFLDFFTAFIIIIFYILLGKISFVPLIIIFLMLLNSISGAYQPAVQASIPLLIEYDFLMTGNAIVNIIGTLSNLIGPIIGGILFGYFGIIPILILSIICFIISAIMEIFIKIPYKKRAFKGIFKTAYNDLKDSFIFLKTKKPIFLSLIVMLALFNLIVSSEMIVGIPIIVIRILKMSDFDLGIAQGALGLGGLFGGILSGITRYRIKVKNNYIFLILCSIIVFIIGLALMSNISNYFAFLIILTMNFLGLCVSTMFMISILTIIQKQTPMNLLGKIMATSIAVSSCFLPIGEAAYGILFEHLIDSPWIILIGSSIIAFFISIYSKKIFVELGNEEKY